VLSGKLTAQAIARDAASQSGDRPSDTSGTVLAARS
jgi:hypothetical protein